MNEENKFNIEKEIENIKIGRSKCQGNVSERLKAIDNNNNSMNNTVEQILTIVNEHKKYYFDAVDEVDVRINNVNIQTEKNATNIKKFDKSLVKSMKNNLYLRILLIIILLVMGIIINNINKAVDRFDIDKINSAINKINKIDTIKVKK